VGAMRSAGANGLTVPRRLRIIWVYRCRGLPDRGAAGNTGSYLPYTGFIAGTG